MNTTLQQTSESKNQWVPRLLSCRRGFAFAPVGGVDEVPESWSNRGFAQLLGVKHIVIAWKYLAVKNGCPQLFGDTFSVFFLVLSLLLAICSISELEGAILTVFAAFLSWTSHFPWSSQHFGARTVHGTW